MDPITDLAPYLDPELAEALKTRPATDWTKNPDFDRIRNAMRPDALQDPEGVKIVNAMIPGFEADGHEVPVRVYTPEKGTSENTLLWVHGGGFLFGSVDENDAMSVRLVRRIGCNIVSVDYRLAPEHPFPAGQNDCYAALLWAGKGPQELGGSQKNIAIGGGSAGGCLAAALALMARDLKGPKICHQFLVVPVLDDRLETRSAQLIEDPRVWNRTKAKMGWQLYLGQNGQSEVSPYASPARTDDLSGLPPASIFVEEMDLLRDEAVEYANRLTANNVRTDLIVYAGTNHGHMNLAPTAEVSRRTARDFEEAVKMAFGIPIF